MAVELNSNSFKTHIAKGYSLVDFWAPWCGPCKMVAPILDELSKEMKGIKIGKVNVDENSELANEYEVMSIPTMLIFKDGKAIDQRVGAGTKSALKEWIESAMEK
jgi:thioredoxin 1